MDFNRSFSAAFSDLPGELFSPVVPFHSDHNHLLLLDLSSGNKDLSLEITQNTSQFTRYISDLLQKNACTYGIGGYDEYRNLYERSDVFDTGSETEKSGPRRLHLGIDIWGEAGTRVFAPLAGTVHSFRNNRQFGDYGATLILFHQSHGLVFHTLYGHLSMDSINEISIGDQFEKGAEIARFGTPKDNGNWPPHLHFQVIGDMQGSYGDYPGVCAMSDRELFLANCPNPDLILRMLQFGRIPAKTE